MRTQRQIDEEALREIEARCLLENTKTAELKARAELQRANAAQAARDENDVEEVR